MDIKMGRRTFLESEVTNTKRREDLAAKMAKLDPAALTEEERTLGVTKLQYMQYREQLSSTATLGWRIEGLSVVGRPHAFNCKTLRAPADLAGALRHYLQARRREPTLSLALALALTLTRTLT